VDATDDKGVVKVEIYIDNQIPAGGTILHVPYSYMWNLSSYPDSSVHTLYAKAYDADGNVTSTSVLTLVLFKFAPSSLIATVVSDTLIQLSWKDNSRKETGVLIERSADGTNFLLVDSVGANITTRSVTGVYLTTTTYWFRIRAKSSSNYSGYSNAATVKVAFPAPSSLIVIIITSASASLRWTDNSTFETGFLIERSTDGVNFVLVPINSNDLTSFDFIGHITGDVTRAATNIHNFYALF